MAFFRMAIHIVNKWVQNNCLCLCQDVREQMPGEPAGETDNCQHRRQAEFKGDNAAVADIQISEACFQVAIDDLPDAASAAGMRGAEGTVPNVLGSEMS